MKNIPILSIAAALAFQSSAYAKSCTYETAPNSTQVAWTAYKTTQKVGVDGSFPGAKVSGKASKKSLADFLDHQTAEIAIDKVETIKTGNPARDQTLLEHFFSLFKGKAVKGSIEKAKGSDTEGDFDLKLAMNGETKVVPMHYIRDNAGKLEAKGEIDVLNFGLENALADLHKSCEALHTGADKVSKTWPNVTIRLTSTINQNCK